MQSVQEDKSPRTRTRTTTRQVPTLDTWGGTRVTRRHVGVALLPFLQKSMNPVQRRPVESARFGMRSESLFDDGRCSIESIKFDRQFGGKFH